VKGNWLAVLDAQGLSGIPERKGTPPGPSMVAWAAVRKAVAVVRKIPWARRLSKTGGLHVTQAVPSMAATGHAAWRLPAGAGLVERSL